MAIAEFCQDACMHQEWGNPAETWLQGETFDVTIAWLNCLNSSVMLTQRLGTMGRNFCLLHVTAPQLWHGIKVELGEQDILWRHSAALQLCFRFENHLWTPQGIKNLQHKAHINSATQRVFWASQNMCALLYTGCNARLVWCGSATPRSGQVNETSQSSQFEVPIWAQKSD